MNRKKLIQKKILKVLFNPRVVTAIISAIGAVISAVCAGCKLSMGEMCVKDFSAEIFNVYHSITNGVN